MLDCFDTLSRSADGIVIFFSSNRIVLTHADMELESMARRVGRE